MLKALENNYFEAMKVWDIESMALCTDLGVKKEFRMKEILHWYGISLDMFDKIIDYYGLEPWLDYAKNKSFEHIFPEYQHPKVNWWLILNYYISKGIEIGHRLIYSHCWGTGIKYEDDYISQTITKFYQEKL